MKIRILNLIIRIGLFAILLSGCRTFRVSYYPLNYSSPANLNPTSIEVTLDPEFKIWNSENNNIVDEIPSMIQRVMEKNWLYTGEKKGKIQVNINDIDVWEGFPYGCFLLFTPQFLGFPLVTYTTKCRVEFKIIDCNDKLVKVYTKEGEGKSYVALYWGYSYEGAEAKSIVRSIENALTTINSQLISEYPGIQNTVNNCVSYEELANKAERALERGDYREAENYFVEAQKAIEGYRKIAQALLKNNEYEKAEKYFNKAGEYNDGCIQIADKLLMIGEYERAEQYYVKSGNSNDGYLKIADALLKNNEYEKAELYYDKAGTYSKGCIKIAEKLLKYGNYAAAERYYIKSGNSVDGYLKIADALLKDKNYQAALQYYIKSGDIKNGYLKLAEAFLDEKDYRNAEAFFIKAGAKEQGYIEIAEAYLEEGNTTKADFYFNKIDSYRVQSFSTSFGSITITRKSSTEIDIDVTIKNPETFCLKSGSLITEFFSVKPVNKTYRYVFDISTLGVLVLSQGNGNYYLLHELPSKFNADFNVKKDEKVFIITICDDTFNVVI